MGDRSYRRGVVYALLAGLVISAGCSSEKPKPQAVTPSSQPSIISYTVSGKVVLAEDNKPLPNTQVSLVSSMNEGRDERLVAQRVTDAAGRFTFPKALTWDLRNKKDDRSLAQRYYVFAKSPEHGFSFAAIVQGDRTDNVTVTLVRPLVSAIKVTDGQDKPLAGATVFYSGGNITEKDAPDCDNNHRISWLRHDLGVLTATTDKDGIAKIDGLYDGSSYCAQMPGHITSYGNSAIKLPSATRLTGVVTFEDGKPAGNATVKCVYREEQTYWSEQAITNAQGRYIVEAAPAGAPDKDGPFVTQTPIAVTVDDPRPDSSYVAKATIRPTAGPEMRLDIKFERAPVLAGKVVDDRTGKPLAYISMDILTLTPGQNAFDNHLVTTNDKGEFRTTVPSGNRVMIQWQDSHTGDYMLDHEWIQQQPGNYRYNQPYEVQSLIADKTDLVLKLRLWDIQPMNGTVVDAAGKPAAGASVYLNTNIAAIKTDDDGKFVLKCAPKDRDFELCAVSKMKDEACLIKLPKGKNQGMLQMKPTVAMDGVVRTPGGVAADNLKFYMDLELNGEQHYYIREEPMTDATGKFRVEHLLPGRKYCVFWSADNETNRDYEYGMPIKIDLASVKAGEPIQFTAKKYVNALMGQVVDKDGKLVAGASVQPETGDLMPQSRRTGAEAQPITTDKDGQFTVDRLADGEITLKVTAAGMKPARVKSATDNVELKVVMRPMTEPTIYQTKVTDVEGKPIEGATVTLLAMQMSNGKTERGATSMKTDSAGRVKFAGPATAPTTQPVQYSQTAMLCEADGYGIALSEAVQMGEDIDATIRLGKGGTHWVGKVVDDKGNPIAGAKVSVEGIRIGDGQHVLIGNLIETLPAALCTSSAADGSFTIMSVGRDAWVNIKIASPGMRDVHQFFDPRQDASAEGKSFTMVKGSRLSGKVVIKGTGDLLTGDGHSTSVQFRGSGGQGSASTNLKPDGTFSTGDLEAGAYTVRVMSSDSAVSRYVVRQAPTIQLSAGEVRTITIEVEEGIPFKGKLARLPAGAAEPVGSIVAARAGNSEYEYDASGAIHSDGSWIIYLPDDGKYSVSYYVVGKQRIYRRQPAGEVEIKNRQPPAEMMIEYKEPMP